MSPIRGPKSDTDTARLNRQRAWDEMISMTVGCVIGYVSVLVFDAGWWGLVGGVVMLIAFEFLAQHLGWRDRRGR